MHTSNLGDSLDTLFRELIHGAPDDGAYVLNRRDAGLLNALDGLSAHDASASRDGGATIAAHVAHLQYGFSLMTAWAAGENKFEDADWSAAWKISSVSGDEWNKIRRGLRDEAEQWLKDLSTPRDVIPIELNGMIGSIVHLAYHLGAMRQISPALRGPKEPG